MVALVSVETLLLVLLVVLVAGLLRSHAEILRRLTDAGAGERDAIATPPEWHPPELRPPETSRSAGASRATPDLPAPALAGASPGGDAIKLSFDGARATPTLLAFLSSGCSTCAAFWQGLGDRRVAAPDVQIVIVTHSADRERPSRLRSLAPSSVPVVMSSPAWEDYSVPGSPYFVLVDGSVRGEGVATSWTALASLVRDAIEDQRAVEAPADGAGRARSVEATLAAGGVGPDHPSLRPTQS